MKGTDEKLSNVRYRPTYLDLKTAEHVTKAVLRGKPQRPYQHSGQTIGRCAAHCCVKNGGNEKRHIDRVSTESHTLAQHLMNILLSDVIFLVSSFI